MAALAATSYEVMKTRSGEKSRPLLTSFSVRQNFNLLFDTSDAQNPNLIKCLRGLKIFSLLSIILVHRFICMNHHPSNPKHVYEVWNHFGFITFLLNQSICSVDTFLAISGMLLTIQTLKALQENRFSYMKLILQRYLRCTVPMIIIMSAFLLFFKITFSNSQMLLKLFKEFLPLYMTFLNIANYTPDPTYLWYISVDFQLTCLSPILIYALWKLGWKFFWVFPAMIVAGSIYTFNYCKTDEYQTLKSHDYDNLLFSTEFRFSAWIFGMMLGYVFFIYREKELVINRILSTILCILMLFIIFSAAYGYHCFFRPSFEFDKLSLEKTLFVSCVRSIWAIAICGIIFLSHKLESGGIFNWILSLSCFQPLERMMLSFFIVSTAYQYITNLKQHDNVAIEEWSLVSFCKFISFFFIKNFLRSTIFLETPSQHF